jgi:hypothetical protein
MSGLSKKWDWDTRAGTERCHVKMVTEIGVMCPQAKSAKDHQKTLRGSQRGLEQILPCILRGCTALPTPCS